MNLYTDEKNIFGEFGIFGMPFFMFEETGTKPGLEGSGELQVDEVNYLQKGEKILTLLREKKQKDPFVADNVMEMVKGRWELTQNTVAKKVGEALEKEFLSVLEEDSELYESLLNACEVLSSHVLSLVEIRPENREREKSLVSVVCHQREKAVINVRYADEDKVDVTLETVEAEHNHSERVSAAVHHHPEDVIPDNMLGTIEDLMIKGYDGNLCFERDFVGEGLDMISRFSYQ